MGPNPIWNAKLSHGNPSYWTPLLLHPLYLPNPACRLLLCSHMQKTDILLSSLSLSTSVPIRYKGVITQWERNNGNKIEMTTSQQKANYNELGNSHEPVETTYSFHDGANLLSVPYFSRKIWNSCLNIYINPTPFYLQEPEFVYACKRT